jgi:hypothetical protein
MNSTLARSNEYGRESESITALAREMQDLTFMHTSDFSTAPYLPMHSKNPELAVILANLPRNLTF